MSFIGKPRYKRGQFVKISAEESARLGVPKDRPWLIVQNNKVRDSLDVVVCLLTTRVDENGKTRGQLTTDVELDKGSVLSPKQTLPRDSYIRCSQLYSARVSEIEYYGTLPLGNMLLVDKMLAYCLALESEAEPETKPKLEHDEASKAKNWQGRESGPVAKLPPSKNKKRRK